ncbi:hypothetical protein ACPPVS_16955 [Cellulomonas sp. McL0617]|uniref:hypothetical protein n=1 Tax=Cellulomonas sp. McL0617 TaxID=3415675 RepID=UPI003CF54DE0
MLAISSVLAACLVASGCGAGSGSGLPPTAAATVRVGPVVDPLTPDGSTWAQGLDEQPAGQLLDDAQVESGISMPWKFLGFGDTRSVVDVAFVAGDGDCVTPLGFAATTDGDHVELRAVSVVGASREACADPIVLRRASVQLPVPLDNGIQLEHAPVEPDWNSPSDFD